MCESPLSEKGESDNDGGNANLRSIPGVGGRSWQVTAVARRLWYDQRAGSHPNWVHALIAGDQQHHLPHPPSPSLL